MHDLAFADASRPRPVTILGLPLRQYSIGHELTLLAKRNPLVCLPSDKLKNLPDEQRSDAIIEAVDVCCQKWCEFYFPPQGWWQRRKMKRVWKEWRRVLKYADFKKASEAFTQYRMESLVALPLVKMPRTHGTDYRTFGQPELASLLNFLIIECQMARESALDMPLAETRMRYLSWLENQGSVRIKNEDDERHEEGKKAWEAQHPENTLVLHPKN